MKVDKNQVSNLTLKWSKMSLCLIPPRKKHNTTNKQTDTQQTQNNNKQQQQLQQQQQQQQNDKHTHTKKIRNVDYFNFCSFSRDLRHKGPVYTGKGSAQISWWKRREFPSRVWFQRKHPFDPS